MKVVLVIVVDELYTMNKTRSNKIIKLTKLVKAENYDECCWIKQILLYVCRFYSPFFCFLSLFSVTEYSLYGWLTAIVLVVYCVLNCDFINLFDLRYLFSSTYFLYRKLIEFVSENKQILTFDLFSLWYLFHSTISSNDCLEDYNGSLT